MFARRGTNPVRRARADRVHHGRSDARGLLRAVLVAAHRRSRATVSTAARSSPNAFQDHAITETAPGHSVTMSGRFPAHTGIVMNAGVEDPQSAAHRRRRARRVAVSLSRLGVDRLARVRRIRAARALSVSRKDRGAILPMGRAKQSVFWYAYRTGAFTTSTYYADTLPTWVTAVQRAARFRSATPGRRGRCCSPRAPTPNPIACRSRTSASNFVFPHPFPADSAQTAARCSREYPPMDSAHGAVRAGRACSAMGSDAGRRPDILAVSLSTTDAVGHVRSGLARVHDQIVRLDRYLGVFHRLAVQASRFDAESCSR